MIVVTLRDNFKHVCEKILIVGTTMFLFKDGEVKDKIDYTDIDFIESI